MAWFDELSGRRRSGAVREKLSGLLAPRDSDKALTALARTEPMAMAQHPAVERLQFFLSEFGEIPGG